VNFSSKYFLILSILVLSFVHLQSFSPLLGAPEYRFISEPDPSLAAAVDSQKLKQELKERRSKVQLFQDIKSLAEKSGARVWALGGIASSFVHYVRWDLLREAGDKNFRPNKFDYSNVQIFSSDQDVDLVIDGDEAAAQKLEALLQSTYPKLRFDVFLLNADRVNKPAILGKDFLEQYSDSHSLGLVEVTDPREGESVIRSAQDFSNQMEPVFLAEAAAGKISFRMLVNHHETSRARAGLNPPVEAIIRYMIKVLQFGLSISETDILEIQDLLRKVNFKELKNNVELAGWLAHSPCSQIAFTAFESHQSKRASQRNRLVELSALFSSKFRVQ